jgi:hypothetical protein
MDIITKRIMDAFTIGLILVNLQLFGETQKMDVVVAQNGKTEAVILIDPKEGKDRLAAEDLSKYIGIMTGAHPKIIEKKEEIDKSLKIKDKPLFIIGSLALSENPELSKRLERVKKTKIILRADAVTLLRDKNRIYLAGSNGDSHCFAVAELLRMWGCRFFMPTEFGESIPVYKKLIIGDLDHTYAPPFEVRRYWISWLGDTTGKDEFMRLNMMNNEFVPSGHCLARYTKEIAPQGNPFHVPLSEKSTAEHVASEIEDRFRKGERIMLGMEDGLYQSDSPKDKELMSYQYDKYFMTQSMTDVFMEFYNNVAEILMSKYPESGSKIGFLAYSNNTIPPVKTKIAKPPLVAYLAPIDIDPIHGMDSPDSPPRQEYKEMMYKWAKVMEGRLVIYDYDQGMLVWRDIPAPSLSSVRQDMKHYRNAGILGVDTESRGAFATTFINLYIRARLMWNPDEDVDRLISEFYPAFYGPADKPMSEYWNAIFKAWEETIVTEHEYFVAPAIYTEQLIQFLERKLNEAERIVEKISRKKERDRNERLYIERIRFTRLGFEVLKSYMAMVKASATEVNYADAVRYGERGLAEREKMTAMSGILTTYKRIGERGYAWWPGEVKQYSELLKLTDGPKGYLIEKMPLEWEFIRDKENKGVEKGYFIFPIDLSYWNKNHKKYTAKMRKDYPVEEWEKVRTDLYIQAQGIREKDSQGYTGHAWYRTEMSLSKADIEGNIHILFPGLFNEAWFYVNDVEVSHRKLNSPLWWYNDYRFEWDVNLTNILKEGKNTFALRIYNPHHMGGIFRRPFLYRLEDTIQ